MQNKKQTLSLKALTLTAVFSALLCIISPFAIPVGPISVTLATFGVYLAGASLGLKRGSAAVAIYLMLGFIGLPVFSGFSGGFQRLFGPTGGYMVGYIPCAAITGAFVSRFKRPWAYPVGMAAGTVALYALGTAWYCVLTGAGLLPSLSLCVFPFLLGDGIKIACASVLGYRLRTFTERINNI